MKSFLIKDTCLVTDQKSFHADVLIKDGRIARIGNHIDGGPSAIEINGHGKHLLPGAIDDQVHFREPGLSHKADIGSESLAAVAGGVTSFMEMPNTVPPVLTQADLEHKYELAGRASLANYSFYMGSSNNNLDEVLRTNDKAGTVCGIKIFMGSSTGNLLVDNAVALERIFEGSELLIATHCEEESIIEANLERLKASGRTLTAADHPLIRDPEACFESSFKAVQLANKHDARLHILHITTALELRLFGNLLPLEQKKITSEVCVHHLHFTADDYTALGNKIKCNPAIKAAENRDALWEALLDDRLDVIATDHAPHTLAEKAHDYLSAHAGLPLVQHSLPLMLRYVASGKIGLEHVVHKMCHCPAVCFGIEERGYIREGYHADLVLVDLNAPYTISRNNLFYKCNWSPLEGLAMPAQVEKTFVNGHLAYDNGWFDLSRKGQRLQFRRR